MQPSTEVVYMAIITPEILFDGFLYRISTSALLMHVVHKSVLASLYHALGTQSQSVHVCFNI